MQKNRFSNITSLKAAQAPPKFNPAPTPKLDAATLKKLRATKNLGELKGLYKNDMTAAQRGAAHAEFIKQANKFKKAAKGSSGQRSTTTKSTKPAPVQPKAKSTKPAPAKPKTSKVQKAVSEFAKRNFQKGKMYGEDVKPTSKKGKFASRDMAKGKMYGQPKRSDYPSGRTGALQYAAALRKFRKNAPTPPARTPRYNRRGRPLS